MRPLIDFADKVEINRSAEDVFAVVSDLESLFAAIQRKKPISVQRISGNGAPAIGDRWRVSGQMKIGRRTGDIEIAEMTAPSRLILRTTGGGYLTTTEIDINTRGAIQTQFRVRNQISADSLRARLASPFIRMFRHRIERGLHRLLKRFKKRMER